MIPVDDIPDSKTARERRIANGIIGSAVSPGDDSTATKMTNMTIEVATSG